MTKPVRSLTEIHEPSARAFLEEETRRPDTLGLILCGSRANGWAAPDGDYDAFILVTPERFRSLAVADTMVHLYAPDESPKRLIGDFTYYTEEALETALASPLDIDHWAYVDAVVLADKSGRLEDWRRRLAAFPEETWKERALNRYLQLAVAASAATIDDVRGFEADRQLNLFRAAIAGVHLWFTIRKRWAPTFKWWTREIERLEIRPDTRAVLEGALLNPSIDTVTHLREHMKTELRYAGVPEVDDLLPAFFATFLPERRAAVYRDSYL
jgi:predicted nucleotidyltransferase